MLRTGRISLILAAVACLMLAPPAQARSPGMIYDVIENVAAPLGANFTAAMVALVADKGLAGIDTTVNVYKRELSPLIAGRSQALPALGLWVQGTVTNARRQTKRDNTHTLVLDYFARGPDNLKLSQQLELAGEALMRCVDVMYQAGGGVWGAGEGDRSCTLHYAPVVQPRGRGSYEGRVMVTVPVREEDTGLPIP